MAPSPPAPRYDTIGRTYAEARRPDPRIAAQVRTALGDARTLVNVGAGTGNYEPPDLAVVAVEPSGTMIAQRTAGSAPAVRGMAEHLPFADGTFDAALAVLTVHHWSNPAAGLAELRRVADRQVVFVFDRTQTATFWLVEDYFPEYWALESEQRAPTPDDIGRHLDVQRVEVIPVPADCTDGFGAAYWQRPEAHLDPVVRNGMSWLAQLDPAVVERNIARLAAELADGTWEAKHGHLRALDSIDLGYRLLICG